MAFDLNEKPFWVALIIGLALGGAVYWAANEYIYKGLRKEISRTEDNIDKLEREIEKGRAAKRDLPRLEEEIAELTDQLKRLRKILPTRRETDNLIKKVKQLTERGNFNLVRFTPMPPEDREFYQEWPIKVSLNGTYHELGLFFDRLSRFSRIINVNDLAIKPLARGGSFTISAGFTGQTFIYKEDDESQGG